MTDYTTLERLAFINGQHDLAELYAKAGQLEGIDIEEIKEQSFNRGYEEGKIFSSDDELLQENKDLKERIQDLEASHKAMYDSYAQFLKWLEGPESRLATDRKREVHIRKLALTSWRNT